jgi:Fur family ferric uptake transcriptional regulator
LDLRHFGNGGCARGVRGVQRLGPACLRASASFTGRGGVAVQHLGVRLQKELKPSGGIRNSLKEKGIRLTRQRQILLDLIDKSGQHLDADRLYLLAKEIDPKLNRVTVYRTLKMLKQGGLVDELDLMHVDGDQHYYETRMKQEHAHVICLRCGKVEEFFGEPLQKLRRQVESHLGFHVVIARTEVGGYCPNCQRHRAEEMRVEAGRVRHRTP